MAELKNLSIGDANFWPTIEKEIKANKYATFKDQTLHCIVFDDSVKMEPFVRTEEVMFEAAAVKETKTNILQQ